MSAREVCRSAIKAASAVAETLPEYVTLLGGGTGTPKLLHGIAGTPLSDRLTIVANTGDDVEFGDLFVSPDVDACLFTAADRIDTNRWWGLADDPPSVSTETNRYAHALGLEGGPRYRDHSEQTTGRRLARWRRFEPVPEFMTFGDEDRAIHRARAAALDRGQTLTEVTRSLGVSLGAEIEILPMSDDPVATLLHTPDGPMHFQEYWVANRGDVNFERIEFRGIETARPTAAVTAALADSVVVIGPSNPVTSIRPIINLDGIIDRLAATTVVAVSPFLGEVPFSGPAAELMEASGLPIGSEGLEEAYPFLDAVVVGTADPVDLEVPTVATDIRLDTPVDAIRVWQAVAEAIELTR